jgi:hypothetical protein
MTYLTTPIDFHAPSTHYYMLKVLNTNNNTHKISVVLCLANSLEDLDVMK